MPEQDNHSAEAELITQGGGTSAPRKQQWSGLVALAQGLALLALFSLAPWFSWRALVSTLGLILTPALEDYIHFLAANHSYSGWATAQGVAIGHTSFVPLVPLWLIPLAALALLIFATLHLLRRFSQRQMSAALLGLSVLALLVQLALFIQASTLQNPLGVPMVIAISWGFWGAVAINAAALVIGAMLFRFTRPRSGYLRAGAGWLAAAAES